MNPKDELDPKLLEKFLLLRKSPVRNSDKALLGRSNFIQEAQDIKKAVSSPVKSRHKRWMDSFQSIFVTRRKDRSPMLSTFATISIILALLFGGGGVTVAAAQSSQPDQPLLYEVKLLSEDFRMSLASDPQTQYQIALDFADRRAEEIQTILAAAGIPPESLQFRYQNQVEATIRFAMNLPDSQAIQALEQIQTRLQSQQKALLQVQANGSPAAVAALLQARQMIQERLQWVQNGLTNPTQLRDQLQQRNQDRYHSTQATQLAPGTGGGNPWTTGTPSPNSGYGPGNGTGVCINCTSTLNDLGNNNPWTTGTPTPNSGYGPGPGPSSEPICTCTPGIGSQSTQQQRQSTTIPGGNH